MNLLDDRKLAIEADIYSVIQKYALSQEEQDSSMQLTPLQIMLVNNFRAACIEQRLALKIDTNKLQEYIQEDAYLRGCIDTYTALLLNHQQVVEDIATQQAQE